MCFHLPPFVQRQWPGLFEESGGQADFSNVVDQTTEMCETLVLVAEPEASGNVACIYRNSRRVPCRVTVACVKRCDEGAREGQACPFKPAVRSP
jgi:hypothetical protein